MPDWQGGGNSTDVPAGTGVETPQATVTGSDKDPQPLDPVGDQEPTSNTNQPSA